METHFDNTGLPLGVPEMDNVKYWHKELSNISDDALIGQDTVIHAGVHIHDRVIIGSRCKIEALAFIPTGVIIQDDVFVGPGVIFTNDPKPDLSDKDWKPTRTLVKKGARIGAGAMIRAGVTIGENAMVGMGSVVLKDVPDNSTCVGNPCRILTTKQGDGHVASNPTSLGNDIPQGV